MGHQKFLALARAGEGPADDWLSVAPDRRVNALIPEQEFYRRQ